MVKSRYPSPAHTPQVVYQEKGITHLKPSAQLAPYIDSYTRFEGFELPTSLSHYPSNRTKVWLNFADSPRLLYKDEMVDVPRMGLLGSRIAPKQHYFPGQLNSLHIAFHLGGDAPFFGCPPAEFGDDVIPLADLLPYHVVQQLHNVGDLPILQQAMQVEKVLLNLFREKRLISRHVKQGLEIIEKTWGSIEVHTLAETLGLSERQLLRLCKMEVGLTPKQIIRGQRFLGTIVHINQLVSPNFVALALEHGYSDQAHLIHEFVSFSGLTPVAFKKHRKDVGFLQEYWPPYR